MTTGWLEYVSDARARLLMFGCSEDEILTIASEGYDAGIPASELNSSTQEDEEE